MTTNIIILITVVERYLYINKIFLKNGKINIKKVLRKKMKISVLALIIFFEFVTFSKSTTDINIPPVKEKLLSIE
jgi:hypothetical protein